MLVSGPMKTFYNATEILSRHRRRKYHKNVITDVRSLLNSQSKAIMLNNHYIRIIRVDSITGHIMHPLKTLV